MQNQITEGNISWKEWQKSKLSGHSRKVNKLGNTGSVILWYHGIPEYVVQTDIIENIKHSMESQDSKLTKYIRKLDKLRNIKCVRLWSYKISPSFAQNQNIESIIL